MNYQDFDAGAAPCDWQESQDNAAACAQIERDQEQALMDAAFDARSALMQFRLGNAEPTPF